MTIKELIARTIELDSDGHLKNMNDWDESLANALAFEEQIFELTPDHWKVINYMRNEFKTKGDAPSIRKLTKESGIDTKTLYALFPKGPAKKAAKIAGLPKPKGCI
ncbi:MAG: TusE/DsrC/DsvC family sulfur relay protein [Bacteroidetes bacterium]|nr:MAG: TusE/DsrC/DsvC family sulfur relay protein [Bacteroidota bacterium]